MLLALLAFPGVASAQRPQPRTAPIFRPAPRVEPDPKVSVRPFVLGSEEAFAAVETFKGIFGQSYEPFFGGGLQVMFRGKYYVEVSASRFKKTGQRAFSNNGETFRLGIPLTATITPLEILAGYRFKPRQRPRVRPYVAGGVAWYSYQETSEFVDATDNVDTRHAGFAAQAGLEFRVHRFIGLSGDVEFSRVGGILGQGGFSKDVGESDLGGVAARFRLIIGR
jgi:opacity protein-like surface antigen